MSQTILTSGNAKTVKGEKMGYLTKGIHFAPAKLSGFNVCRAASKGCELACLNTSGRGGMTRTQESRIAKTIRFFQDRLPFLSQLGKELEAGLREAKRKALTFCGRPNLTSDLPFEKIRDVNGQTIFERFSDVQFYDYTKIPSRMHAFLDGDLPSNYHLTFSRSESNAIDVEKIMARGGNVAVVFRGNLPKTWQGVKVVNGDESDLRFLDKPGVVVGLVEKGLAKKDATGFVQEV